MSNYDDFEKCHICGQRYPSVYSAEDDLWRKVTGITDGSGNLCIACFDRTARSQGVSVIWRAIEYGIAPCKHGEPYTQCRECTPPVP